MGLRLTGKLACPDRQGPGPREGFISKNKVDGAYGGMSPEVAFCLHMYVHKCAGMSIHMCVPDAQSVLTVHQAGIG